MGLSWFASGRATSFTRKRAGRAPRLGVEALEDRTVPSFAATLAGTVATFTGNAASDTIAFQVVDGQIRHNRFTAGDAGFASDFDFVSGDGAAETRLADGAGATVNVLGGGGADVAQVTATAGNDVVTVAAANGRTVVSRTASATYAVGLGAGGSVEVFGDAGNDTVNLQGTVAGVAVRIAGGAGADALLIDGNGATAGGTVDGVVSAVTFDGGTENNTVALEDTSDTTADTLTVTPTQVGAAAGNTYFGPGGSLTFTDVAVAALRLPGATAGDAVTVTPSASTAFAVEGNGPTPPALAAGDALTLNATGATLTPDSAGAGAFTLTAFRPVTFTGFERVSPGVVLSGTVFDDLDGDGQLDPGEPGLPGITVRLDVGRDDTFEFTTATDAAGAYRFTDLAPANAQVVVTIPAGRFRSGPESIAVAPGSGATPTVNFGTVASASIRYVSALYVDLLGRAADPAGLAFWVNRLNAGTSRLDVALGFQNSDEFRRNLVNAQYRAILGRAADPGGLDAAVRFLEGGAALHHLQALLLGSEEFYQARAGGTPVGYLQNLYRTALGRELDAAGQLGFGELLARGFSRATVAGLVLTSEEGFGAVVAGLYQRFLRRPADNAGFFTLRNALRLGVRQEVVTAFLLSSEEYFNFIT